MINAHHAHQPELLKNVIHALSILSVMANVNHVSSLVLVLSAIIAGHLVIISHPIIHAVFANLHLNETVTP